VKESKVATANRATLLEQRINIRNLEEAVLIKKLFLYAVPKTILVTMLSTYLQVHSAQAEQADTHSSAALAAISDTADRICGTVSTQAKRLAARYPPKCMPNSVVWLDA